MIEPTDEMVQAFNEADFSGCGNADWEDSHVRVGLAAVLAIVERDYEPRRCDELSWVGHRCTKPRGHGGGHQDRFSGTVWP